MKFVSWAFPIIFVCFSVCLSSVGAEKIAAKTERIDVKPDSKSAESRGKAVLKLMRAQKWDEFEQGARDLIKDFPNFANGYCDMMILIGHFQATGHREKARQLAEELAAGPAPEKYKAWANGALARLDSMHHPLKLQFTAIDGREVDLEKMKGKVVLIDFWSTRCEPCLEELPTVKAAYEKLHERGFEVIGISFDESKPRLLRFLKSKALPWPQYYDGKAFAENKLSQAFGIDGIPHMILVDKKGQLRADNIRAKGLEERIVKLLEEN